MGFLTWLRNALAGPPQIQDGGDPGAATADLQEEYGVPGEAADDLGRMGAAGAGGGYGPAGGFGASEAAEAAEADLASEESPPDPS